MEVELMKIATSLLWLNVWNEGGGPRNFGELTSVNTRGSEGGSLWSAYGLGAAS